MTLRILKEIDGNGIYKVGFEGLEGTKLFGYFAIEIHKLFRFIVLIGFSDGHSFGCHIEFKGIGIDCVDFVFLVGCVEHSENLSAEEFIVSFEENDDLSRMTLLQSLPKTAEAAFTLLGPHKLSPFLQLIFFQIFLYQFLGSVIRGRVSDYDSELRIILVEN